MRRRPQPAVAASPPRIHFRRVAIGVIFAELVDGVKLDCKSAATGKRPLPTEPESETWVIAGRGAGKSRWAS